MDLPEKAKRAPSAPVWNQSFPSPSSTFEMNGKEKTDDVNDLNASV